MPRLSPQLIRQAARKNALLPLLLRECRDLPTAQNELRWLKEHALEQFNSANHEPIGHLPSTRTKLGVVEEAQAWRRLVQYVHRRANGEPLQYILGTQPFGDLEILCRPGVLIPRPETEGYTVKVARLLKRIVQDEELPNLPDAESLKVLDLCTGTGCISLLLHSLLKRPGASFEAEDVLQPKGHLDLQIRAIDISDHALALARENLEHHVQRGLLHPDAQSDILFQKQDILENGYSIYPPNKKSLDDRLIPETERQLASPPRFDVLFSNPPYISPAQHAPGGSVSRSVRKYEPILALVPPAPGAAGDSAVEQADVFYPALLKTAARFGAKLVILEVGEENQAERVAHMARTAFEMVEYGEEARVEIWSDNGRVRMIPSAAQARSKFEGGQIAGGEKEAAEANERAVVVWRGVWAGWRRRNPDA